MKKLLICLLALVVAACSKSSGEKAQENTLVEQQLKEIMEAHSAVGLSVAAVKDGKIVYSNALGYKDRENKVAMKEDDILRIASISKTFVGTGIMQLVEAGKLGLDDDISTILGVNARNPKYPDKAITVRMLLSHTSSMSDKHGYFTMDDLNDNAWESYEPGSKYQYCNLGFNTLGAIIEKVSGVRFDKYIYENILKPIGVYAHHNVMELDSTKFIKIYKYNGGAFNCSKDAYASPESKLKNYVMGYSTPVFSPTGGLKISAKDLARVMIMHMNYGTIDGVKILDKSSCELMQSELTSTNYPGESYGFSMISSNDLISGVRVVGHDGLALGAYTAMYWDRKTNFGVVVMTNGCDGKTDKTFANILCKSAECLYKNFAK